MAFNQPKICPEATWNPSGTTFAVNYTIGNGPRNILINVNNTVYAVNHQNGSIQIWLEGSSNPTGTIATDSNKPYGLFVSMAGDIYIDNGFNNRVDVWRDNNTNYTSTLWVGGTCYSIFLDTNQTFYCSLHEPHKVIKRSLDISDTQLTTVAGTGCAGNQPHMLYYPHGIFVANNSDLYVADTNNHRIQLFRAVQLNGTTVAGRDAPGTMQLDHPKAVTFDADGYLFIVDSGNCRIIGSGPYGFRCVIGCTSNWGSAPNQLANPQSMAFDSYGNIFVVDTYNDRLQKFSVSFNSCSESNDCPYRLILELIVSLFV